MPGVVKNIMLVALNDFRLTFKERSILLWIFAMPVVFMLFFGAAFRGSRGPVKAGLAIENADSGFVSRALIGELKKEPLNVIDTLGAGEEAIRTLVIPSDFTEKVLEREKVTIVLRKKEDSNIEASQAVSAAIFRCLVRVVSGLIEIETGALESGAKGIGIEGGTLRGSLGEVAGSRPEIIRSFEAQLDSLHAAPPLVTVASELAGRARVPPSGFQGSVPGNLVMFVLMSMVFSGIGITVERQEGILRRFAYTPAGKGSVVVGKLLGRMGISGMQILFLLMVGRFVFRVSLGHSPAALVILMAVFAFCAGSFGVLFGSIFRNPEQVSAISIITTLTMSALGGCWWPIEIVSRPFKVIAFMLPTGWAMDGLHKLISFGFGMSEIFMNIAVLALFGAAFILIASRKLTWSG